MALTHGVFWDTTQSCVVAITGTEVAVLAVGCVVAFVVSLAAIRFLMDYVKRHNFTFFGIYRIALGLVVLAVAVVSAMV